MADIQPGRNEQPEGERIQRLGGPNTQTMATPEFTILIDGDCPLCKVEADLLRKLDRGRGRLDLIDIADPRFDAGRFGTTFEAVMGHIHGVLPDGSLVTGMEVFRRAYAAVGLGWTFHWTGWPVFRWLSDRAYGFFARYRLAITGRRDCGERCRIPGSPPAA